MKKVVLALFSALILTVFISFNYLLWDRENKIKSIEDLNSSKNLSLSNMSEKISNLEYMNKQLQNSVNELNDENKKVRNTSSFYEAEMNKAKASLAQKNEVIGALKQIYDLKPLEETVLKWVGGIDQGKYNEAYALESKQLLSSENFQELAAFTNAYKSTIKGMKLKSILLINDNFPNGKKGDIVYKAVIDVKRIENSGAANFNEGVNERYFTLGVDELTGQWSILGMSATQ